MPQGLIHVEGVKEVAGRMRARIFLWRMLILSSAAAQEEEEEAESNQTDVREDRLVLAELFTLSVNC